MVTEMKQKITKPKNIIKIQLVISRSAKKEAESAAEALYDLVTENFCDIVGNCDEKIVSRLVHPGLEDEDFAEEFESQVYKRLIKKLGGK